MSYETTSTIFSSLVDVKVGEASVCEKHYLFRKASRAFNLYEFFFADIYDECLDHNLKFMQILMNVWSMISIIVKRFAPTLSEVSTALAHMGNMGMEERMGKAAPLTTPSFQLSRWL